MFIDELFYNYFSLLGQFATTMARLREHPDEFFGYFRMSIQSFDELLSILEQHITKKDTILRKSIPAVERLAITLR